MPLYMVETISYFRHRYVVDAKEIGHAHDTVTMLPVEHFEEFSQKHIDESIISSREITREEYLKIFDEDNDYLKNWKEEMKFQFVKKVDYDK